MSKWDEVDRLTFTKKDTQVVKGVAIIMMIIFHLFADKVNFADFWVRFAPLTVDQAVLYSGIGNVCVSIFVFLTVYGIEKQMEQLGNQKKDSWNNLFWVTVKRYATLMIGFIFVFVITNLIFCGWISLPEVYGTGSWGVLYFLLDLFALPQFFGTVSLNATWWYMELAILLIILLPVLYKCFQKVGILFLPILLIFPYVITTEFVVRKYILIIAFALAAARYQVLERLREWRITKLSVISKIIKGVFLIAIMVSSAYLRQSEYMGEQIHFVSESILAFAIVVFTWEMFCPLPVIKHIFAFLGKYSMNIYLTHTFFNLYFPVTRKWIYHFIEPWMIILALFVISLAYAIALDLLKKVLQVERLQKWVRKKCDSKIV